MSWKNLFNKNREISTEETKTFIDNNQPGAYQLLDVRQPKEYEQQHLPGALLIPLSEISTRITELDPTLETIVYCRSGVRSNAACQHLREQQFPRVLNMKGGILRWQGQTALGGEDVGVEYFLQGNYENGFEVAYNLEVGLQNFYLLLSKQAKEQDTIRLLFQMAQFEEGHMAKLLAQCSKEGFSINTETEIVVSEGGLSFDKLTHVFGTQLDSAESVLQLAMMFEAQAFDLYSRLARKSNTELQKKFYLQMATEEQSHLDKLAAELDNLLT